MASLLPILCSLAISNNGPHNSDTLPLAHYFGANNSKIGQRSAELSKNHKQIDQLTVTINTDVISVPKSKCFNKTTFLSKYEIKLCIIEGHRTVRGWPVLVSGLGQVLSIHGYNIANHDPMRDMYIIGNVSKFT